MPNINNLILKDRAIFEISGDDCDKFLQGLITNDITKASEENMIYSAMLNAQGRFLYDFFIFRKNGNLIIDCYKPRIEEIIKKLNFYKLRSKVKISENKDIIVCWSEKKQDDLSFKDPRNENLGYRNYKNLNETLNFSENSANYYHYLRIINKVPESEHDLTYEKSFILEFNFDNLNAVDYNKGCYVGQEPTARIHHLGQIRKEVVHLELEEKLEKNSEISCEGKKSGIVLSSVSYENKIHALALLRISQN